MSKPAYGADAQLYMTVIMIIISQPILFLLNVYVYHWKDFLCWLPNKALHDWQEAIKLVISFLDLLMC